MSLVDPFRLFANGVRTVSVWQYSTRPGVQPVCLTEALPAIVKRSTSSNLPADYGTHEGEYSLHVRPVDFPENVSKSPGDWLSLVVDVGGRRFLVVGVSVGDDYDRGEWGVFWRVYAQPYARSTL